ncbi:MAG: helix-turn-helix domain-containing protein [Halovenus sp.]
MIEDKNATGWGSRRDLCVVFDITPVANSGCPLAGFDDEIREVRQQYVGDVCHTDTTLEVDDCACSAERECTEVVHTTTDVDDTCPCTVFGEFGCIPKLVDIDDGEFRIETYLSDRERLSELVDALKTTTDGLRLRQLKRIDTGEAERSRNTVTLDLFEITEKQRQAATKAIAAGYYASPRETSLDELASEFEISTSALSQRLNAVESKLATAAFAQASAD